MAADRLPAADYLTSNRQMWDRLADEYEKPGRELWTGEPRWGIFGVPEDSLGVLPEDLEGVEALEAGCGTGYVSAWLARGGARPVGIDNSARQLANARRLQREFSVSFPLVHGVAENLPFCDGSFDLVISEYGASIWSDPYLWIPQASRVLRPGGLLIFLRNSSLLMLCVPDHQGAPARAQLRRAYFGMHRMEWPDGEGIEFHLGHGDWIRLLRQNDFVIEDLIEIRPGADATTRYDFVDISWARRWPSEEVWKARKQGG